jgi:hypothetical protein
MTLNASGNLSLGNTNDTYKLDVTGTGRFYDNTTSEQALRIENAGVGDAGINIFAGTGKRVLQRYYIGGVTKWGIFVNDPAIGTDSFGIYNYATSFVLSFASTGAATFSSSVTASGNGAFNTTSAVSGYALDVRGATNKRVGVANSNSLSGANLLFYTDANAFADGYIDASKLILQSQSGGNVGIGTASPNLSGAASGSTVQTISATTSGRNALLELNGTRTGDGDFAGYLRYFNNSAATPLAEMYALRGSSDTTGSLVLATSGSERMRITSGGIVSIGASDGLTTSTYAGKLAVYTAGGANLSIGGGSNTTNTIMSRFITVNTNNGNSGNESSTSFYGITSIESALTTSNSNTSGNSGGYIMFKTKGDAGTLDERLRIASNGLATFSGDVKVKTLEITNVGTDSTSSGVSTYMRITVNGQNYLIPLHGTP